MRTKNNCLQQLTQLKAQLGVQILIPQKNLQKKSWE
ncbi:Uncharacterised protein [Vibrio cholerae]|nr:Uncharacterised protein [Vibrio cholerae]